MMNEDAVTPASKTPPDTPGSRNTSNGSPAAKSIPASKWFHGVGTCKPLVVGLSSDVPTFVRPRSTESCENPRMTPPAQWRAITSTSRSGSSVRSSERPSARRLETTSLQLVQNDHARCRLTPAQCVGHDTKTGIRTRKRYLKSAVVYRLGASASSPATRRGAPPDRHARARSCCPLVSVLYRSLRVAWRRPRTACSAGAGVDVASSMSAVGDSRRRPRTSHRCSTRSRKRATSTESGGRSPAALACRYEDTGGLRRPPRHSTRNCLRVPCGLPRSRAQWRSVPLWHRTRDLPLPCASPPRPAVLPEGADARRYGRQLKRLGGWSNGSSERGGRPGDEVEASRAAQKVVAGSRRISPLSTPLDILRRSAA